MLLVKSVYDLSEIVSEINKDDPYRAKMGFNRVFKWKCFRTQLPRVKGAGSFHDIRKSMKKLCANDTSRYPKVLKIGPNHGCQ